MRYSPQFMNDAFRWLVFGEGNVPPPWQWRTIAWMFLVLGAIGYLAAVWLFFVADSVGWALAAGVAGYLLRRQVRIVAPQLLERASEDIEEVPQERGSGTPATGAEAEFTSSLFDVAARWVSHPDSVALQERMASLLAGGEADSVEQEFSALHLAVIAVGTAALDWPFERRKAEIEGLTKAMGALMAPGTDHSQEEWGGYYQGRIAYYERAVPSGTDAKDEDLVGIGDVFVKGVLAHPRAPSQEPIEDVRLEMGTYFWVRLTQFTQAASSG